MPDEVLPEGDVLDEAETMFVYERVVVLDNGVTVWLRRFYYPGTTGARRYLADGQWCVTRGGMDRMFAGPQGVRGGCEWVFGMVHGFETWQAALCAARESEGLVVAV